MPTVNPNPIRTVTPLFNHNPNPRDEITTYMKLEGVLNIATLNDYLIHDLEGDTWTVCGKDKTTGQNSTLTISKRRAGAISTPF